MPAPTCPTCNLVLLGSRCRQCGHVPEPAATSGPSRPAPPSPPAPAAPSTVAGWLADPAGRHQYRYWDGQRWTDHVADHGVASVDPPPANPAHPCPPLAGAGRPGQHGAEAMLANARERIAAGAGPAAAALARTVKEAGSRAKEAAANHRATTNPTHQAAPGPAHRPPPPPGIAANGTPDTSGRRGTNSPPKKTAPPTKQTTTGDAILKGLSIVTLNSWASKRMAEAFMIPALIEAVAAAPADPAPRLHLGLRLQEMERLSSRISRSGAPTSATGLLLRPVTRPLSRAAVRALRSDNTPASDKALESAYQAAMAAIRRKPRNPRALDTLARIYQAKGHPHKAVEVATASSHADPRRPDPYYIAAEACFALGAADLGRQWAVQAIERGSTLARALLDPTIAHLRVEFTSTKARMINMPTTMKYWQQKTQYFARADPAEVCRFYGPSAAAAA